MQMVFADGKYDGRQIVTPESLREMFWVQNANVELDFDFKMRLGWGLSGIDVPSAGTVACHGGTTLNYHSLMVVLPEQKLGVVVVSNSVTAEAMVGNVATETHKLAPEAKRGITQPVKESRKAKEVPLGEADIRGYDGYFDTLIGPVKVSARSGDLVAEVMGQKLELIPREENQFGARFILFGFIPLKIGALEELSISLHRIDGHDVLVLKSNNRSMLIDEKIEPVTIPPRMLDYVGEYEIISKYDGLLPQSVRTLHEDGLLIGAFTFAEKPVFIFRVAFKPVAADELVTEGLGPGKGETMHLKKLGTEHHIYFSDFDLRKKPINHS
jgi:hypothetical protein